MLSAIDLTGSEQEIETILAWAKQRPEVDQVSEPTSLDTTRALNVGLPEIKDALTFLTLVFTTGTAALEFLKALRDELKIRNGVVTVSESVSGKPLGRLEGGTSDSEITQLTPK
jgi:hypothetical protein